MLKKCSRKVPLFFFIFTSAHETYVLKRYRKSPKFQENSGKVALHFFFQNFTIDYGTYVPKQNRKRQIPKNLRKVASSKKYILTFPEYFWNL